MRHVLFLWEMFGISIMFVFNQQSMPGVSELTWLIFILTFHPQTTAQLPGVLTAHFLISHLRIYLVSII